MEIPDDFGKFKNNIVSVGMGIWYDGDYSDIFNWLENEFLPSYNKWPTDGYVFGTQVVFSSAVFPTEAQYICFNQNLDEIVFTKEGYMTTYCAGTQGDIYGTYTID